MTFVFFITDCLFAIVMLVVWETYWWLALAFFLFFGALDGVYLSANLNKVRQQSVIHIRACSDVLFSLLLETALDSLLHLLLALVWTFRLRASTKNTL